MNRLKRRDSTRPALREVYDGSARAGTIFGAGQEWKATSRAGRQIGIYATAKEAAGAVLEQFRATRVAD